MALLSKLQNGARVIVNDNLNPFVVFDKRSKNVFIFKLSSFKFNGAKLGYVLHTIPICFHPPRTRFPYVSHSRCSRYIYILWLGAVVIEGGNSLSVFCVRTVGQILVKLYSKWPLTASYWW
jgi:hypothetical protein